jgi:hypothetical protein
LKLLLQLQHRLLLVLHAWAALCRTKRFDTMFPFEAEQAAPKRGLWLIPAVPTCTSQLVAAGSAAAVKFTGKASGRLQFKDVT